MNDFIEKLSTGKIHDAGRIINHAKKEAALEDLAKICVKHQNDYLTRLCLSKMKNAKSLRSISNKVEDVDHAAAYSLHLGFSFF